MTDKSLAGRARTIAASKLCPEEWQDLLRECADEIDHLRTQLKFQNDQLIKSSQPTQAELAELKLQKDQWLGERRIGESYLQHQRLEIERLRAALEWYANQGCDRARDALEPKPSKT